MSRAILLCPVILALLVAPSLAVTCDSYKTEEKCTGMVDGTNKCAWEGGACVTTSETLGEGMVGITSVPVDMGMPDVAVPVSGVETNVMEPPTNNSFCSMPPDSSVATGIACMAYMEMFSYNKTKDACEMVVYGGCGATQNLFSTLEECETAATTFCGMKNKDTTATISDSSSGTGESTITGEDTIIPSGPTSSAMMQQPLFSIIPVVVASYSSWLVTSM
jgi:hypothetical protein